MKKNLYFTTLMISTLAFSAEHILHDAHPETNSAAEELRVSGKRNLAGDRAKRLKYATNLRFYGKLAKELTLRGILAQHEVAVTHKPGRPKVFSRDQKRVMLQAFRSIQDDQTKAIITRKLSERDAAPLVEKLLLAPAAELGVLLDEHMAPAIPRVRPRDAEAERVRNREYRERTHFFRNFVPELIAQGIFPEGAMVASNNHYSREQQAEIVRIFREHQNEPAKNIVARKLGETHAPLVLQLLGINLPQPSKETSSSAPPQADPDKKSLYRIKYYAKMHFFRDLADTLSTYGVLSPDAIVVERRAGYHARFSPAQQKTMQEAFLNHTDNAVKDGIVRKLKEAHAPLVQQLLENQPQPAAPKALRPQHPRDRQRLYAISKKHAKKELFFRVLARALVEHEVISPDAVGDTMYNQQKTFSDDQRRMLLEAFNAHHDKRVKSAIARKLAEFRPPHIQPPSSSGRPSRDALTERAEDALPAQPERSTELHTRLYLAPEAFLEESSFEPFSGTLL